MIGDGISGACALASGDGGRLTSGYFAFPASASSGEVHIFDVASLVRCNFPQMCTVLHGIIRP